MEEVQAFEHLSDADFAIDPPVETTDERVATDTMAGFVRFKSIRKVTFTDAVNEELEFRGISRRSLNARGTRDKEATLTEKLKRLEAHEAERRSLTVELLEGFQPLSGVAFNVGA